MKREGTYEGNYWWWVKAKDGTPYSFGLNPSTTSSTMRNSSDNPVRWYVDQVDDVDGNRMKRFYTRYTVSGTLDYSVLPAKIEYSYYYNGSSESLTGNKREVVFNKSTERDDLNDIYKSSGYYTSAKLDSIEVS